MKWVRIKPFRHYHNIFKAQWDESLFVVVVLVSVLCLSHYLFFFALSVYRLTSVLDNFRHFRLKHRYIWINRLFFLHFLSTDCFTSAPGNFRQFFKHRYNAKPGRETDEPNFSWEKFSFSHQKSNIPGIAQWLERRTRDWKVAGSNPCWSGGRIFFSRVDFLCWLLFRYPFHPVLPHWVARKRSRSFCEKCRWQVTAKHAYTLRMWLCMKWHGAWLYGVHRTCAETAAVSCATSHASAVSTPLRWIFKKKKKTL